MLTLIIKASDQYNDAINEFITIKEQTLQLEHSLISISQWESKWKKPFMSKDKKTVEETLDYVRCMSLNKNVDDMVYQTLSNDNISKVQDYIEEEMTATTFGPDNGPKNKKVITSELIYYWIIALNIPIKCEKWHLSRLMTLINICNIENTPPKKMNKRDTLSRNAATNAARKKKLHSEG